MRVFWYFLTAFIVIFRFYQGWFDNFKFLNIIKKKLLKHVSAYLDLHAIKMVNEGPNNGQSPAFILVLEAMCLFLFNGRTHPHKRGLIELHLKVFSFSLSFLRLKNLCSHPIIARSFVQKNRKNRFLYFYSCNLPCQLPIHLHVTLGESLAENVSHHLIVEKNIYILRYTSHKTLIVKDPVNLYF